MAALTINNLDENLIDELKTVATAHSEAVDKIAADCLKRGVRELKEVYELLEVARRCRELTKGAWLTDEELHAAIDEGRP